MVRRTPILSVVVAATLVLEILLAGPAAAAVKTTAPMPVIEPDKEEILDVQYENGKPVRIITRAKDAKSISNLRRFELVKTREFNFEQIYETAGRLWTEHKRAKLDTSAYVTPELSGSFLSILQQGIGNLSLLVRGLQDIGRAIDDAGKSGQMENMYNDPVKKYEFWKRAGIYEKYTPGEIAFLNSVVFPAAAVLTTLGEAVGGLTAAGGIGLIGFVALTAIGAPVTLGAVVAGAVGLTAATLLIAQFRRLKEVREGKDLEFGGYRTGLLDGQAALFGVGGIVSALGISPVGSMGTAVGSMMFNSSLDRKVALENAAGIPVPVDGAQNVEWIDNQQGRVGTIDPGTGTITSSEQWETRTYLSQ